MFFRRVTISKFSKFIFITLVIISRLENCLMLFIFDRWQQLQHDTMWTASGLLIRPWNLTSAIAFAPHCAPKYSNTSAKNSPRQNGDFRGFFEFVNNYTEHSIFITWDRDKAWSKIITLISQSSSLRYLVWEPVDLVYIWTLYIPIWTFPRTFYIRISKPIPVIVPLLRKFLSRPPSAGIPSSQNCPPSDVRPQRPLLSSNQSAVFHRSIKQQGQRRKLQSNFWRWYFATCLILRRTFRW